MPFVYDYSQVEWTDADNDPPPPRVDQFVYLPAPEFGGSRGPVHFTLDVPPEPPPPPAAIPQRLSLWDRLRGRKFPMVHIGPGRSAAAKAREAREFFVSQRLIAVTVVALRELGVRSLFCRYDGGSDEGFSWLEGAALRDGSRIGVEDLAQRLTERKFLERLAVQGVMKRDGRMSELEQVTSFIRDWMCTEWATLLLGRGYGTGEYMMYGAFVVDLDDCSVVDDPGADPVVNNIEIGR